MTSIPIELVEQFQRRNVLVFVGEGIYHEVLPSPEKLAQELASRFDYPAQKPLTLSRVANDYETTCGRHELVRFLQMRLDGSALKPGHALELLAEFRPRVMVTTCYNRLLEQALQDAHVPYVPVVGNSEIAYDDESKVLLVWLWGVLDQPNSIVVTEDDRRHVFEGRANLSDVLRAELARRTWLIIGFDLRRLVPWFL